MHAGVSEELNAHLLKLHDDGNNTARASEEIIRVVPKMMAWCNKLAAECGTASTIAVVPAPKAPNSKEVIPNPPALTIFGRLLTLFGFRF